jgi:hypothetical protein
VSGKTCRGDDEAAEPSLIHYPVTTSFWRGVYGQGPLNRTLRRACDWRATAPKTVSFATPSCPDCVSYKANLQRLGYVR